MGKRSSHGALAVRLVENGHTGMTKPRSPLAGLDEDREQGYLRKVRPKSDGQRQLIEAIERHHLTIALGPAGTGKTYLAVSAAVTALEAGEVGRIVLTRPAVEAGERLGYLPGDIGEKLAPYLRPLSDALNERLGGRRVNQLMSEGAIEIAPIAYMRGRTLNNAFIVIDEAQNCAYGQIKMMLPATFVVNAGISGNRLSRNDAGPSALARFDRDVLSTPGFGMSFYSRALTTSVATMRPSCD
jgi:phosphate starvation-inducible protein PhoH and related proteins